MEALKELEETWWLNCVGLNLSFCDANDDGRARLEFTRPLRWASDPSITAYVRCSKYRASLAVEQEFVHFVQANSPGYGFLSISYFCMIGSSGVMLAAAHAMHWMVYRSFALPTYLLIGIVAAQLLSLSMMMIGAKLLFPRVQFALGSGSRKSTEQGLARERIVELSLDLIKILVGAALGAWLRGCCGK